MRLHLTAKEPGPGGIRLRPVSLDLSYAQAFRQPASDAYERLLMDVVRGNPTLFMRRDEVEAAWTWVEPILQAWTDPQHRPRAYAAGTTGPTAATTLIERDGRSWHESRPLMPASLNPVVETVTDRIVERSRAERTAYLRRMHAAAERGPARGRLACANLAHGFAASGPRTRRRCAARSSPTSRSCPPTTTCSPRTSRSRPTRPSSRRR